LILQTGTSMLNNVLAVHVCLVLLSKLLCLCAYMNQIFVFINLFSFSCIIIYYKFVIQGLLYVEELKVTDHYIVTKLDLLKVLIDNVNTIYYKFLLVLIFISLIKCQSAWQLKKSNFSHIYMHELVCIHDWFALQSR
ncbi:hypothetical protein ACJX0J_029446, partial [Zea mays]